MKRSLTRQLLHRLYRRMTDRLISGLPAGPRRNEFYDRQTVQVMERVLRRDSNCIDLGAHTGAILEHMVRIAPAGHHQAFEPLPHLAAELRGRFPSVEVHETAVGEHSGVSEFQYVTNDPGYSGLQRRLYDREDAAITPISVNVVRLDDVIPASEPIAFMKMDLEGGEYHALRGGVETIRRSNPVIVFEAALSSTGQYGVTPEALFELVTRDLGYRLSTMTWWFRGWAPFTLERFCRNWKNGPDFYFIATPDSHPEAHALKGQQR